MKNFLNKPLKFDLSCKFLLLILIYIIYNVLLSFTNLICLSEGSETPKEDIPKYFLIIILPYLVFCYYFFLNILNFKNIRFIIFPVSFSLVIFYGFVTVACFTSGAIVWVLVFAFIPICIFILLTLIVGLIFDLKDWINFIKSN